MSSSPGFGPALLTSLLTATIAAGVIAVFGTPLAFLLARSKGVGMRVLGVLVALPLALPPLMSGLLLLYVVGPYTTVGKIFGGQLTETRAGIVLAQTFVAAPFFIIVARAAFAGVDPALEDVAASLGHGRLARLFRVAIPTAIAGLGAGLLLAWLRAFAEFGATIILAYHPYSLPVFTFVQFDAAGLPATMLPIAAALATALVLLTVASLPIPRRRSATVPRVAPAAPRQDATGAQALQFAVAKHFPGFSLDVSYQAASGRLALLGPSGAGKTLTLRLLAGLSSPDQDGHVAEGSRQLDGLPAERRGIAYVPQSPALLPRRTVWRQVMFGADAKPAVAAWWLRRLGLAGLEGRFPDELSGGERQRVSLVRALATQPRLLLLDEPFTGLDAPVRDRFRRELRRLQHDTNLNTVIVTHDPEEAALLADEIIVLRDGRILQCGMRESVFDKPTSPEVAGLLGIPNTNHGSVLSPGLLSIGVASIHAPTGRLPAGHAVIWSVRPERISVDSAGRYRATLIDDIDLGALRELTISLERTLELVVRTDLRKRLTVGQEVRVDMAENDVSVWPVRDLADAGPGRTTSVATYAP